MEWRVLFLLLATLPQMAQADTLRVGFGQADVTPILGDKPVFIAGFGQNRRATEIVDRLQVRAVVFQSNSRKIAMASVDVVGLFLPVVERIRKQLPGFDYIIVSSTHNHHGPDTMGLWGTSPLSSGVDPAYLEKIEKQTVAAIRQADSRMQDVTPWIGTARNADLLHDSRAPIIKHDELVSVLFRDVNGKPAGLIVQWNCHPETLSSNNTKISSDFVGAAVAAMEKKHACQVVYLTGTVGGLMTSMRVEVKGLDGKRLPEGSFEKNQRYGELVADLADNAIEKGRQLSMTPFKIATRSILLPVDNVLYRTARQVGVFDRAMEEWHDDPFGQPGPLLTKVAGRPAVRSEIGRLQLGELDIAVIPGEIYPELVIGGVQDPADPNSDFPAAPIEPTIYANMVGPFRMIVGLGNDELGYILPKRQWDLAAPHCYGLKKAPYGETNSLGPETGPIICNCFQKLKPN